MTYKWVEDRNECRRVKVWGMYFTHTSLREGSFQVNAKLQCSLASDTFVSWWEWCLPGSLFSSQLTRTQWTMLITCSHRYSHKVPGWAVPEWPHFMMRWKNLRSSTTRSFSKYKNSRVYWKALKVLQSIVHTKLDFISGKLCGKEGYRTLFNHPLSFLVGLNWYR